MNAAAPFPLDRRARRALAAAMLVAVAGSAAAADFRGFVTDGPAGLLLFQTCQGPTLSKQLQRVSDKSPDTSLTAAATAVRQVMEDRERPLYVEFAGDGSAGAVTVRRFHRAIGHVTSCAAAPRDIVAGTRLHAGGDDPGPWMFVATSGGARLQLDGRSVRFAAAPFASPTGPGRRQVYDAWSAQDGGSVRLEVTEEMCLQEHTETATGARAALRYGSTSVDGCAARF